MGAYTPVRDANNKIVDFIDSRGRLSIGDTPIPEPPSPAEPEPAEEPARRRGLTIEERRPLAELLGGGGKAPPPPAAKPVNGRQLVAGALVLILSFGALFTWRASNPTAAAPAPTAAPTGVPTAAATVPTARPTLPRAVVAYDAPGGTPVGALDAGRCYTPKAEQGGWRQLDVCGSGLIWVRAWEMDGVEPPTATPAPTNTPLPTAAPAPVQIVTVGPPVTCVPVVDGDNNGAYLGEACGVTSEERQQRALELLEQATPFLP